MFCTDSCRPKYTSWAIPNAPSRMFSAEARTIPPSKSTRCSDLLRWLPDLVSPSSLADHLCHPRVVLARASSYPCRNANCN